MIACPKPSPCTWDEKQAGFTHRGGKSPLSSCCLSLDVLTKGLLGSHVFANRWCVLSEGSPPCREEGGGVCPHSPCSAPTQNRSWSSWGQGTNHCLPGVLTQCKTVLADRQSQQMPPRGSCADVWWVVDNQQATSLCQGELGSRAAAVVLWTPQEHLDGGKSKDVHSLP